ncbi:hypothetical protein LTR62_001912 [Meristemomyces frigidus]|uniref:DUF6314 domain-containing protein n=1 Tax=Meristemomyces frigidus TaxID=1508187 RepID=A0AAN7TAN4_9PEZI|nr:hypothetical protein LTR62_001912 [Meristemomyces frigidus]
MKKVCIIGAGPAGLVTAKTLLDTSNFAVALYEKSDRIGGIWALDDDTPNGYLSPQTPTNLSKFTVGFCDLDWGEVDGGCEGVPLFPKAFQVNQYLEEYRRRYLGGARFCFGATVVKATRQHVVGTDQVRWHIESQVGTKLEHEIFDHLVVASGFFSKPRAHKLRLPGPLEEDRDRLVTIHSSQFRSLAGLFNNQAPKAKNILIIGGGNSGGETAAAVAMQLSDTQWSPDRSKSDLYSACEVIHVISRPLYALPPFVEYEKGSRSYVPLDLKLYDYSKRPPGMESYGGLQSPAVRDIIHNAIRSMVGGDQSELGYEALVGKGEGACRGTGYVALSESYSEFARSGLIVVKAGTVVGLDSSGGAPSASVVSGDQTTTIENIGAVIHANGYEPTSALDYLDDAVKHILDYDPDNKRLPVLLGQWQTANPEVPELAFVGMYEGPYWPMMEMQARLTASRWSSESNPTALQLPFESKPKLLELRSSMKAKAPGVGQYWFNDYLGYCEDIAQHLQLTRNNGPFESNEGCTSPARWLTPSSRLSQAEGILEDLHGTWTACLTQGKFVARAVMRALHGTWDITRTICNADPAYSGTLEGNATFYPRYPTPNTSGKVFELEYLYHEHGTFTPASNDGVEMKASRTYIYRYSSSEDTLSIWFTKPEDDRKVDYPFHSLLFSPPAEARKEGACIATARHLCVEDVYETRYRFPMEAIVLRGFEVRHEVKGPRKDYVSTTSYCRPVKVLG